MKSFNLKEYIKNPNKKVITRNGRPVRIVYTDKKGMYPIVALIEYNNTYENVFAFTTDGRYSFVEIDEKDLFFAPERHDGWINIFGDSNNFAGTDIFKSKEDAEKFGKKYHDYKATIKIEWEE